MYAILRKKRIRLSRTTGASNGIVFGDSEPIEIAISVATTLFACFVLWRIFRPRNFIMTMPNLPPREPTVLIIEIATRAGEEVADVARAA